MTLRVRGGGVDLAFTCPTCSWIFVTEVQVPVPGHPDCLLGRICTGVGAIVPCVDVRPEWRRGLPGAEGAQVMADLRGPAAFDGAQAGAA